MEQGKIITNNTDENEKEKIIMRKPKKQINAEKDKILLKAR
jgi:hypothetical protein